MNKQSKTEKCIEEKEEEEKSFRITRNKGFHLAFSNGIILSVQFGTGNYCENRHLDSDKYRDKEMSSNNCEIGIWNKDGDWITKECKLCSGYDDVEVDEIEND